MLYSDQNMSLGMSGACTFAPWGIWGAEEKYLWTFDKYYWTAVSNGCPFVDKSHFGKGSQPDCRRATLPTKDGDRMICHGIQEQCRCSRLVSYVHKKLLLGR